MATEPIQVLDGIVRGLVSAGQDFGRLVFVGFMTPFVTKSRRFWRGALSANKHLSTLTFLALWTLVTLSVGLETSREMISGAVGFNKPSDLTFLGAIVSSIICVFVIDVMLRSTLLATTRRVRREMYLSLARIGVANIFLGATVWMLFRGPGYILPRGFGLLYLFKIPNWFGVNPLGIFALFPKPLLFLFSISLGVILVKALSIKSKMRRLGFGLLITLTAPILLANVVAFAIFAVYLTWAIRHSLHRPTLRSCRDIPNVCFIPIELRLVAF